MRKFLFVIALVFVFTNSQSQEVKTKNLKSFFGVKAGFNFLKSSNDGNSTINFGYQIGSTYEIPISSKFSFQPELLLQSIGGTKTFFNQYSNGTINEEVVNRNSYLQLPLLFKFKFSNKFNIDFGPNAAFIISAKKTSTSTYNLNGENITIVETTKGTKNFKKVNFGLNLGANYFISEKLYTGFRYTIFVASYQTLENSLNNSVFAFSLGYNFK